MSYSYEAEKPSLFTDEGQRDFLLVRDWVQRRLNEAGAFRMQEAMAVSHCGTNWGQLARVDRLVELGEIREITSTSVAGQHRVFVASRS